MRTILLLGLALVSISLFGAPGDIAGGGGDQPALPSAMEIPVTQEVQSISVPMLKNAANGIVLAGQFSFVFSNGVGTVYVDHVQNLSASRTSGTLQLSIWATTYQPARGASITGYRLATFPKLNPLPPNTEYAPLAQSTSYSRPPDGSYWITLVLAQFDPASCPGNADGYCAEDNLGSFTQVNYSSAAPAFTYTDIWYTPSEPGWGVSITHHSSNTAFIAWYTYDELGRAKWYYVDNCPMMGNSCAGIVSEATGPPFAATFNPSAVKIVPVGTINFTFSAFGTATMSYYVKGVSAVKTITRLSF